MLVPRVSTGDMQPPCPWGALSTTSTAVISPSMRSTRVKDGLRPKCPERAAPRPPGVSDGTARRMRLLVRWIIWSGLSFVDWGTLAYTQQRHYASDVCLWPARAILQSTGTCRKGDPCQLVDTAPSAADGSGSRPTGSARTVIP